MFAPNILTIAHGLLVGIILVILPKTMRKILVPIIYVLNIILFIVNYMLILIKSEAFTVYNFQIASEGFKYINFVMNEIDFIFLLIILISTALFIFTLRKSKKINCNLKLGKKIIVILINVVVFLGIKYVSIESLDDYLTGGGWEDFTYPKFYTDHLINSRKSISVLGLYEYTLKDIQKYYEASNKKYGSVEEIESIASSLDIENTVNDMTGIFEGKNLIMIMMESIDNVIVDEETMPTLSKMMNEGWNFTKRYSQLNSGGSTIATEYTTLSGLYHSGDNRYDINDYQEAIPSIFGANNYKTSSFHENNGVYYNRSELHKSLGFENSYFLYDMDIETLNYVDAQFFENNELYDLVVPRDSEQPFMSFITTISAHGPYINNSYCNAEQITDENECFRYLAK